MDAFAVNLFASSSNGFQTATIDLGRQRRLLAWGAVSFVDSLIDFDRDNAYYIDIFLIDGLLTNVQLTGGDHLGPPGAATNFFDPVRAVFAQRITFRLRVFNPGDLNVFGTGIVLTLD